MARTSHNRRTSARPPALNRYGSFQAYHALLERARKLGIDLAGTPMGVCQIGHQLFLYADVARKVNRRGKWRGFRFTPRIIRQVRPLDARDYLPRCAKSR